MLTSSSTRLNTTFHKAKSIYLSVFVKAKVTVTENSHFMVDSTSNHGSDPGGAEALSERGGLLALGQSRITLSAT